MPEPVGGIRVSMYMIKVLVCGRGLHGVILQFLEHHLKQHPDIVVEDHCTPEDMPARVGQADPDVVLMIVGIPREDDVANVAAVSASFPARPIIAVSMALDERFPVTPLLKAGATAVVVGEEALDLPQVITEVVAAARAELEPHLTTTC
ncbi:MAG: response regulator [Armatimonadota bacterium]